MGKYTKPYHNKLVNAKDDKVLGNHKVEKFGTHRYFFYFGSCVCSVDDIDKTFELDACGWGEHRSTKICLAGYREVFTELGYKEVNPKPIWRYEK